MEKKSSISVISTQMQLINTVEAIKEFGCTDNTAIICSYSRNRDNQINSILSKKMYKNIFSRQYRVVFGENIFLNLIKTIYFRLLIIFVTLKRRYDICFISHYWYPNHKYIAYRSNKSNCRIKVVLVDDGTGTISFYKDRIEKEICQKKTATRLGMKTYRISYFASGLLNYIPSSLIVYTIYQMEIDKNDILKENNYNYLKGNVHDILSDKPLNNDSIVFLGQPFVKVGLLDLRTYEEYLINIHKSFENKSFIYIPHPAENVSIYNKELLKIYRVINIDIPVEIFCISQDISIPVVGFNTSAIPNIKLLDKEREIISVKINDNDILKPNEKIRMNNVYEYFRKEKIKIYEYKCN